MSIETDTTPVTYKTPDGFPAYRVGDDGSVWTCLSRVGVNVKAGESLKPSNAWTRLKAGVQRDGYLMVCLSLDGGRHYRQVHRLVLETFVGPCPNGMQCRHLDGDPANNNLSNLRWGTSVENHADRKRHGTDPIGMRNNKARLTDEQVKEIRRIYESGGTSQDQLARKFGIHQTQVSNIVRGKHWSHLAEAQ